MILRLLKVYRSARVTAEALAWHHGKRGVAMARSAAEGPHGSRREAFQARPSGQADRGPLRVHPEL